VAYLQPVLAINQLLIAVLFFVSFAVRAQRRNLEDTPLSLPYVALTD